MNGSTPPGAAPAAEREAETHPAGPAGAPQRTRSGGGAPLQINGRRIPRWLFMRAMGLVHIIAFASLWVQIEGLAGSEGIMPAADYVNRVTRTFASRPELSWIDFPSLTLWLGASDAVLGALCCGGVLFGLILLVGFVPRLSLLCCWFLYLSLQIICRPFLNYQWDILLLEATLMAVIYAPPGLWPRIKRAAEPSAVAVWVMRLLLFKLVLSSGVVKINSGDPTWREWTALDYHFWTQPIPHGAAWYAHQAPEWVRSAGVWLNHVVELCVPALILFNPRRWLLVAWLVWAGWDIASGVGDSPWDEVLWALGVAAVAGGRLWPTGADRDLARWPAAVLIGGLMASIGFTGNYGFFNVLTVALCLPLLDDRCVLWLTLRRWRHRWPATAGPPPTALIRGLVYGGAAVAIPLCLLQMVPLVHRDVRAEARRAVAADEAALSQRLTTTLVDLHDGSRDVFGGVATFYGYGLFARMTTSRYELQIEGSHDGRDWRPYRFHYKPNAPDDPLVYAGVHMPRLDWQMWFAALRPRCRGGWFVQFLKQIVAGAPGVKGVFAHNPFPGRPPDFVRVKRFRATFTDGDARDVSGAVWHFEPAGLYCPVLDAKELGVSR